MEKKIYQQIKKDDGFTLIELIIVLTIIGVIMSIAIPGFTKNLDSARLQADKASARTIATATQMAFLDKLENITLDRLVSEHYLEKKPLPQRKDSDNFSLTIDAEGKIIINYEKNPLAEPLYSNSSLK